MKEKEKKQKKPNIHKGHRGRVKNKYKQFGIEIFHDHNILEFLLFFGIPLKDTNELAHELISRFGSLSAVFFADIDALKSVKNMTDNAAVLIHFIGDLTKRLFKDIMPKDEKRTDFEKIDVFLKYKYIGVSKETVYLLLFDQNNRLVDCVTMNEGENSMSSVNISKIVKIANLRNISRVALAHNHPDNSNISSDDVITTRRSKFYLKGMEIELLDSYVVVQDNVLSIFKSEQYS